MIQKNVHVNIIPFTIDVDVSAHQIPSSPMIPLRTMASGILALVSTILITLQSSRSSESRQCSDRRQLHAHKCLAESNDHEIALVVGATAFGS